MVKLNKGFLEIDIYPDFEELKLPESPGVLGSELEEKILEAEHRLKLYDGLCDSFRHSVNMYYLTTREQELDLGNIKITIPKRKRTTTAHKERWLWLSERFVQAGIMLNSYLKDTVKSFVLNENKYYIRLPTLLNLYESLEEFVTREHISRKLNLSNIHVPEKKLKQRYSEGYLRVSLVNQLFDLTPENALSFYILLEQSELITQRIIKPFEDYKKKSVGKPIQGKATKATIGWQDKLALQVVGSSRVKPNYRKWCETLFNILQGINEKATALLPVEDNVIRSVELSDYETTANLLFLSNEAYLSTEDYSTICRKISSGVFPGTEPKVETLVRIVPDFPLGLEQSKIGIPYSK